MNHLLPIAFCIPCLLIGLQLQINELRLLTGKYNYKIQRPQFISYIAALWGLAFLLIDISLHHHHMGSYILVLVYSLIIALAWEYILTLINPSQAIISWSVRMAACLAWCAVIQLIMKGSNILLLPFYMQGALMRNSSFGIPHAKMMYLAHHLSRKRIVNWEDMQYVSSADQEHLPNPCYAGNDQPSATHRTFNIIEYGILPNTKDDLTSIVQELINEVGQKGGGCIYFPKGRYHFNKSGGKFLQINHSHITIEGETDEQGKPLAELINCGKTSRGHKNPWISPFFLTTGEQIQPSNEFWGLQFRKRKFCHNLSGSLSDPGSDGNILTPDYATRVIAPSHKGETLLHVEHSGKLSRYILIGMYNTSDNGNLIKDILGTDHLSEQWTIANRAGAEQAPSYQWLVEVRQVIDEHTVELVRPFLRDCDMCYEPEVYNVQMLEDICIRNLHINSHWNGQYHHHGFPLYYSIKRCQEMDYGWNAINMKRVAHGNIKNIRICNFTNPLYIMDSRNVSIQQITIEGYDGHQGLKVYAHACDNLFQDIDFHCHFSDMMGGEGNAYSNVFRHIAYLNPVFAPVDYDFHGFAEAPMSPPSHNMFTKIYGFRYIKSAGPITHLPSCGCQNAWWNIYSEGERFNDYLFYAMSYRQKTGILRIITAVGYAVAMMLKQHTSSPIFFLSTMRKKYADIAKTGVPRRFHRQFLPGSIVKGIRTTSRY